MKYTIKIPKTLKPHIPFILWLMFCLILSLVLFSTLEYWKMIQLFALTFVYTALFVKWMSDKKTAQAPSPWDDILLFYMTLSFWDKIEFVCRAAILVIAIFALIIIGMSDQSRIANAGNIVAPVQEASNTFMGIITIIAVILGWFLGRISDHSSIASKQRQILALVKSELVIMVERVKIIKAQLDGQIEQAAEEKVIQNLQIRERDFGTMPLTRASSINLAMLPEDQLYLIGRFMTEFDLFLSDVAQFMKPTTPLDYGSALFIQARIINLCEWLSNIFRELFPDEKVLNKNKELEEIHLIMGRMAGSIAITHPLST